MKLELEDFSVAIRLVIVGIVIFSIAYPLAVALGGQIWRGNAQGSLVKNKNGEVVGSKLIGQDFDDPRFFHGRPSWIDYNAMVSGSQNLAPQENILFSAEFVEFQEDLKQGVFSENLKVEFEKIGRPLPDNVDVVERGENKWRIRDDGKDICRIRVRGEKLEFYRRSKLERRVENILEEISGNRGADNLIVPSVLVTESGSALDPHITYRSAMFQVPRIAEHTPLSESTLRDMVENHTKEPLLGIYGRERVNVLLLNKEIIIRLEEV